MSTHVFSSPAHDILPVRNTILDETNENLEFYSAWFCPYAQRVWITLHFFDIPYHYNEIQLYENSEHFLSNTKVSVPLERKPKEFVKVSPKGLVPALNHNKGIGIHESSLCIQYLQDVYSTTENKSLLPSDPYDKFLVRKGMILVDEKIIPHFYKALMCPDKEGRERAKNSFLTGLEEFGSFMETHSTFKSCDSTATVSNAFFMGKDLTMADIMLAPWFYRIESVLEPLRGINIPSIENCGAAFKRLHLWWECVQNHSAVKSTFVNKDVLLQSYGGYANNTATSDVAKRYRDE